MPPEPRYFDPFLRPRPTSPLSRLRYRLSQRVEAWVAELAGEPIKFPCPRGCGRDAVVYDTIRAGCPVHGWLLYTEIPMSLSEAIDRRFPPKWTIGAIIAAERKRLRRRSVYLLALALAMAGCGGALAAVIILR